MAERRFAGHKAAEYLGISPVTWRGYVFRGVAPAADGHDDDLDRDYWLQSTLDTFKANRIGQGKRTDLARRKSEQTS